MTALLCYHRVSWTLRHLSPPLAHSWLLLNLDLTPGSFLQPLWQYLFAVFSPWGWVWGVEKTACPLVWSECPLSTHSHNQRMPLPGPSDTGEVVGSGSARVRNDLFLPSLPKKAELLSPRPWWTLFLIGLQIHRQLKVGRDCGRGSVDSHIAWDLWAQMPRGAGPRCTSPATLSYVLPVPVEWVDWGRKAHRSVSIMFLTLQRRLVSDFFVNVALWKNIVDNKSNWSTLTGINTGWFILSSFPNGLLRISLGVSFLGLCVSSFLIHSLKTSGIFLYF